MRDDWDYKAVVCIGKADDDCCSALQGYIYPVWQLTV